MVDDNARCRAVIKGYLETFGFHVQMAESGARAVEMAARQIEKEGRPFDLVLMDWQMPGMDGVECAGRLQKIPGFTGACRIILVTGLGMDEVTPPWKRGGQQRTALTVSFLSL